MKIKKFKQEIIAEEISLQEAVDRFYAHGWWWHNDNLGADIENYLSEFVDLSEEAAKALTDKIKERHSKVLQEYKDNEIKGNLDSRENIIKVFNFTFPTDYSKVGLYLSSEEILDTILKNGNK